MPERSIDRTAAVDPSRSGGAATYRVYRLSDANRIIAAEILDVITDGEAIATVRSMVQNSVLELWDRSRFLGRFDPRARAGGC